MSPVDLRQLLSGPGGPPDRPLPVAVLTMELQRGVIGDLASFPELAAAVTEARVVEHTATLLQSARRAGAAVVHCTAEFRNDLGGTLPNTPLHSAVWHRPAHLRQGTPAVELVPELGPDPSDFVCPRSHGVSPFTGTSLDALLRHLGVRVVVATGVSVNVAVTGLCIEAVNLGYQAVVPRDAVAGVPAGYAEAVVDHTLALLATITHTDELVAVLSEHAFGSPHAGAASGARAPFSPEPRQYYQRNLAHIHDAGFGFHAERCAPGILKRLQPVLERRGLVVELGCGSGALTGHLLQAGHRVLATDASPAMLDLARANLKRLGGSAGSAGSGAAAGGGYLEDLSLLRLPDDRIPEGDAVVSVGHVLSYLDDEAAVHQAITGIAEALRPDAVMAIDLCDAAWGRSADLTTMVRSGDGWFLVTQFSLPSPDRFDRDMTTFVQQSDGSWRRDDEVHHNVLVDTSTIPHLLERLGVSATIETAFGHEILPAGLVTVIGRRPSRATPDAYDHRVP